MRGTASEGTTWWVVETRDTRWITFDTLAAMKHHEQVFLGYSLKKELFLAEQYKDLLDDLLDPGATLPPGVSGYDEPSAEEVQTAFEAISREVKRLVEAVNKSVQTAQESDDVNIRKSEIETARATIAQLQHVTDRHPSVQLERLEEVMLLIERIDRETATT
jgi:hypothetical protein